MKIINIKKKIITTLIISMPLSFTAFGDDSPWHGPIGLEASGDVQWQYSSDDKDLSDEIMVNDLELGASLNVIGAVTVEFAVKKDGPIKEAIEDLFDEENTSKFSVTWSPEDPSGQRWIQSIRVGTQTLPWMNDGNVTRRAIIENNAIQSIMEKASESKSGITAALNIIDGVNMALSAYNSQPDGLRDLGEATDTDSLMFSMATSISDSMVQLTMIDDEQNGSSYAVSVQTKLFGQDVYTTIQDSDQQEDPLLTFGSKYKSIGYEITTDGSSDNSELALSRGCISKYTKCEVSLKDGEYRFGLTTYDGRWQKEPSGNSAVKRMMDNLKRHRSNN